MRTNLGQRRVRPTTVAILLLLLLSSVAYAGPSIVYCSCDVDDQIDAQGPLRGDASGEAWTWANNETVILQNEERWRQYRFRSFGGLFIKMPLHGEGQYDESSENGGVTVDLELCPEGPNPTDTPLEEECENTNPSPILLDLDRNQFHLSGGPVEFDIDADGRLETISWVSAGTRDGFLFLDRNLNGLVDDGSELFGDSTTLFNGEKSEHGYAALAEFDLTENGGNRDGVIDDADWIFPDLGVWVDSNMNGIHESSESQSLAAAGVLSIDLDYRESRRKDSHGNEFRYLGTGAIEVDGKSKKMATTDVFLRLLDE